MSFIFILTGFKYNDNCDCSENDGITHVILNTFKSTLMRKIFSLHLSTCFLPQHRVIENYVHNKNPLEHSFPQADFSDKLQDDAKPEILPVAF